MSDLDTEDHYKN